MKSFVHLLEERAAELSAVDAYLFLTNGEIGDAVSLNYGELGRRARAVGAFLQRSGLAGERVLLLYPPGLDFIVAFLGCLYGGAVAVPASPPRSKRSLPRFLAISRDARPAAALAPARHLPRLETLTAQASELRRPRLFATELALETSADTWERPDVGAGTLAFLQYTSGSTSSPRGVEVSHGNLWHNAEMIRSAFRQSESSVIVGWLPLYHDMGLIGNVLQPLYLGARCILMSSAAFLQRPRRWLEVIDHYRATTSGGPNFAYELCVRRIPEQERAGLDLSCWTVAFNGAEPVRASTLDSFTRAFASCGFRREAFYPCYGLAEATLLVTGGDARRVPRAVSLDAAALEAHRVVAAAGGDGERRSREVISCGRPWLEQELVIVNPATRQRLAPSEVGEIWIRGASVARGYWGRAEASDRIFRACLADEPDAGTFLRTGDLGFLDRGELFVAGRLKDVVILRGRNHYPQDLELTAERAHPTLRFGCGAAFSVEVEGEERLTVVWELGHRASAEPEEVKAIAGAMRQALAEIHEVQLHELVLLRAGTVPKTSSGKIQRHACRAGYLSGQLEVIARSAPFWAPSETAACPGGPAPALDSAAILSLDSEQRLPALVDALRREVARHLRVAASDVDAHEPLTRLGLDSLAAIELSQGLEDALGTGVPLAELIDGSDLLRLARALLERLEAAARPACGPSPPAVATGEFALSHGQQALWFLHRMAPEARAYNIAVAARVVGLPLDLPALGRAFAALARRHPALRTTFHSADAEPRQRVHDQARPMLMEVTADAWSEIELTARLEQEADQPFDLETGPLLRAVVFRRGEAGDVILLSVHHIVADFWSLAIVGRELGTYYLHELNPGADVALPAPPAATYGAYVGWQRELLAGERGAELWRFWRDRLAGLPPALELPTDRPRPRVRAHRGAALGLPLGSELSAAVFELARRQVTTLFTTLLAAFQALLHRYTGQEDLAVGSPVAGRGRPELAGIVGYFAGPVVLRAEFSGRDRFETVLGQAHRRVVEALEHHDFPFGLLAERLQPIRDASRPPLFQVLHVHQRSPDPAAPELAAFAVGEPGFELRLGGLTLESLALPERSSQFDLTLRTAQLGSELFCSLQYDTDLFDAATVRRILGHLRRLLAAAAARPELPVCELPLLSDAERAQVFEHWSGGELEVPEVCLHQLVAARAGADPGAEAMVVTDGAAARRLSYGELERQANRLAHALVRRGAGPEARVGVCLERSADLVVALLAVLKAGAAYVPLDPTYPRERLALMLEASGSMLLLARGPQPVGAGRIPWLDPADPAIAAQPLTPPEPAVGPGNLAYVIFTSGSTGQPKGVAIEHRAAVHLVHWARGVFSDLELSGVLAATSICFDLSVFELFVPLVWGGRVILADNALALVTHPAGGEVRLLNTVPSAMAELAAGELPPSLATINLAGEPLAARLIGEIGRHSQIERLYNLYGPSEDTTYSTWARFDPRMGPPERVTIGRPLAGGRALAVDRFLRLVPAGVVGELYLGGAGLARGYVGREAATADRFVPDPWATRPGSRLYRTGDLARFLPTGKIDYVGRRDHQVKIRGFRIEPGEIEAVLGRLAAVREAVVVLREDLPGGRGLVAFFAPAEPGAARVELEQRLRAELERRLPRYMCPAFWAVLEELPHTRNGKIDRRALAARPLPAMITSVPFVAPRTPVEEILAGTFAELLDARQVGVRDDFFGRGGHSLLAVRLASRIRADFGVEVPLPEIFQAPTVAELTRRIESSMARCARASAIPRLARQGPVPLSSGQRRLWLLAQMQPDSPAYNMPIALELQGELHVAAMAAAFGEIVRRQQVLHARFEAVAGEPVQVIDPVVRRVLPQVDLSTLPGPLSGIERRRLAEAEARRPFDLAAGRLLRVTLVRLGEHRSVLLIVAHHAVADGWSLEILGRELSVLYRAILAGTPSPLEPLPIQYADFAFWQQEWLAGEGPELELGYWRAQLAGAPTQLELATDRPRPRMLSHRGARRRLASGLPGAVEALARRQGLTGFMVCAAAFGALLARSAGQREVLVGAPVAQRERPELQSLIGFLVDTVALRLDPSGDPTLEDYLRRVRQVALGAYAHRNLPFDLLVEELAPAADRGRSPLFQAMILLAEPPLSGLDLPGLEPRVLDVETGTAKFDLTLRLERGRERWLAVAEHSTELFDATTIDRLLAAYARALRFFVEAGAETRLSALPLLSAIERHQLFVEADDEAAFEPSEATLGELFAARARRSPDAVALAAGDLQLSFGHAARRVNALARRLAAAGVSAEARVGLLLPRSAEQMIGLLAILEMGGCYVPLDPDYPAERLRLVAEEAALTAVLTREELRDRVLAPGAAVLCLGDDPAGDERAAATAVGTTARPVSPDGLAYVLYTSGSTGRPKGVMVTHRSAVNLLGALELAIYRGADIRVGVNASLMFDASVKQWLQLLHGRRLELIPDDVRLEARRLGPYLARRKVEAIDLTPSQLAALVETGGPLPPRLLVGGEEISPALWRRLVKTPGVRAFNVYGPTECTVDTTVAEVTRGEPALGRPVAGATLRVLDRRFEPVPLGGAGQLWIGGAGLARGYLGQAATSAERFVPDPWSRRPGTRLYGSGDLVRWRADGGLAFLGRTDRQVKIRGFRIELGEIEAAIADHPRVREAAVVVDDVGAGGPRLVAFAAGGAGTARFADELRRHLEMRLPRYMVPPLVVPLEHLPRTRNGKLDRAALTASAAVHPGAADATAVPRSPLEEVLAGMMAEVLERDAVGVHDDFFALGGHSLLAAELIATIQDAFQIELPLRRLFEAATVADLADFLTADPELGEQVTSIAPLLLELVEAPEDVAHQRAVRQGM